MDHLTSLPLLLSSSLSEPLPLSSEWWTGTMRLRLPAGACSGACCGSSSESVSPGGGPARSSMVRRCRFMLACGTSCREGHWRRRRRRRQQRGGGGGASGQLERRDQANTYVTRARGQRGACSRPAAIRPARGAHLGASAPAQQMTRSSTNRISCRSGPAVSSAGSGRWRRRLGTSFSAAVDATVTRTTAQTSCSSQSPHACPCSRRRRSAAATA